MRAETDVVAGASAVRPRSRPRSFAPPRVRRGLDWFELLVLLAFAAVSVWVLALDLFQVIAHGRAWTGTDGVYVVDQMQYLAWIRSASHHFLVSNLFVLRSTPADYFQPAITFSGGLAALGVPPWLALLLWKPVAVIAAFYGVRAYAYRSLTSLWERRVALVLGLFFGSATVIYGDVGVIGDMFPGFLSWGYTFGLLAVAVLLFALLAYSRARDRADLADPPAGRRGSIWAPALLGALASLLHPWQGELLILIVIGTELVLWRRQRPALRRLGVGLATLAGTGLPLLYYLILGHADLSWKLARVASKHSFSLFTILLAALPLLTPALLAYRGRARNSLAVATRVWAPAALLIYVVSATSLSATPLHAFEGITVPLSILAIEGLRRAGLTRLPGWRVLVLAAVAAATIPATVAQLHTAKPLVSPWAGNPNFVTHDERQALRYLARVREPGGVLTRFYLGTVVPAETGRRTFVGDCLWSQPNCTPRSQITQMVFDGALPAPATRWFVERIGARFVLADCNTRPDMSSVLAPLTGSVRHFGCAAVYTLRGIRPPQGPLAESPPDAALRASGRQQRRVQHA